MFGNMSLRAEFAAMEDRIYKLENKLRGLELALQEEREFYPTARSFDLNAPPPFKVPVVEAVKELYERSGLLYLPKHTKPARFVSKDEEKIDLTQPKNTC